jgi:hypothetical protein
MNTIPQQNAREWNRTSQIDVQNKPATSKSTNNRTWTRATETSNQLANLPPSSILRNQPSETNEPSLHRDQSNREHTVKKNFRIQDHKMSDPSDSSSDIHAQIQQIAEQAKRRNPGGYVDLCVAQSNSSGSSLSSGSPAVSDSEPEADSTVYITPSGQRIALLYTAVNVPSHLVAEY